MTPVPSPESTSSSTNHWSSSKFATIFRLFLRILTVLLLLISFSVLGSASTTLATNIGPIKVHFNDIYAYRYEFSTGVVGFIYTLIQISFGVYHLREGKKLMGNQVHLYLDFYGDKLISLLLGTGVGAGFGITIDLKRAERGHLASMRMLNTANVSTILLLLGFFCMVLLSILSSLALARKD